MARKEKSGKRKRGGDKDGNMDESRCPEASTSNDCLSIVLAHGVCLSLTEQME